MKGQATDRKMCLQITYLMKNLYLKYIKNLKSHSIKNSQYSIEAHLEIWQKM